mmetsp:Transcript_7811/g.7878  ORF Transcript_7811/g.7878 Transcript_7811/m.7878 type:complete len:202 (+) Transcript_7811:94-699(+)
MGQKVSSLPPLKPTSKNIDIASFMGKWHVMANIPMAVEVGASNGVENYSYNKEKNRIDVLFEYIAKDSSSSETSKSEMHATIKNAPVNSFWALNPKIMGMYVPLNLSYLVLDVAENGSYALIGVPDRQYLWLLTRQKPTLKVGGKYIEGVCPTERGSMRVKPGEDGELNKEREEILMKKAFSTAKDLGYDLSKILKVKWTN